MTRLAVLTLVAVLGAWLAPGGDVAADAATDGRAMTGTSSSFAADGSAAPLASLPDGRFRSGVRLAAPATTLGIQYVVVVLMENRAYTSIVGSPNAPYLNSLMRTYGLATNYFAVAHPSEPNYLALFGGSTFGVVDDGVHNISGVNLADQLEAHGLTWRIAAENVPPGCFKGATAYGGSDGPGWYARKHEPAVSFRSITGSAARCRNIGNLKSFTPGAATVQFVIPNFCHDMHDCSTAKGDAFLQTWLAGLLASPTFKQTLLLITWDDGLSPVGGGGRVATILAGPTVPAGTRIASTLSHYSLLRSIEDLWQLGCLRKSCQAANMLGALRPAP